MACEDVLVKFGIVTLCASRLLNVLQVVSLQLNIYIQNGLQICDVIIISTVLVVC